MWYKNPLVVIPLVGLAIWVFLKYVRPMLEGFENPSTKVNPSCPKGYKQCPDGDCISEDDPHQTCPHATDAY